MIYKFRIISGEEEDFIREIEISENATFLDLHQFVQEVCNYDAMQLASFFLCDENWEKEREITLFNMQEDENSDKLEMASAMLKEHTHELKQKLIYVFDFFSERGFFIEMVEISEAITGISYPLCATSIGNAPQQLMIGEEFTEDLPLAGNEWEDDDDMDDITFENIDDFDDFEDY